MGVRGSSAARPCGSPGCDPGPRRGQTMEASGGRGVPRRVREGLITCGGCSSGSGGARGALKHTTAPHACSEASPPRRLPAPTARPLPPLPGPAWKGSKARLPSLPKLGCSPFLRLQQQWSPARESGSRGASPGLAPAAARPAPRSRPPSVTPAPRARHCGPATAGGGPRPGCPRRGLPGGRGPPGRASGPDPPRPGPGAGRPEAHPK